MKSRMSREVQVRFCESVRVRFLCATRRRSIRHFCELYETYFKDGTKELVAIRESIRLDSALGRALINILLVFAQMEREATGERTREAIHHIRQSGYHFGKAPYGKKTIPAPDNPRMKVLVDDEAELAVIAQLKAWAAQDVGITEMAHRLNAAGTPPPQGERWTKSLIYNLRLRLSHIQPRPINERHHTDRSPRRTCRTSSRPSRLPASG